MQSVTPGSNPGPAPLAARVEAPPRAAGLPLLGSALPLVKDPLTYLRQQYALLGPVFEVVTPGRKIHVLAGTEANRFVATRGRELLSSGAFWGGLCERRGSSHSLIAVDGEDHRSLRRLFSDDLSKDVAQQRAAGLQELAQAVLEPHLEQSAFVARDVCRLLTSRQVHHLLTQGAEPVPVATASALMEVFRYESNVMLLGKWPRLAFALPRYRRSLAIAERFIDALIDHAERERPSDGWFHSVLQGREAYPQLFEPDDVRLNFLLPFIAGVDTVGATLGFILYELTRDPALRERVRDAVDACHAEHGGMPGIDQLRALDPLRGLVMEALRLYPAAFGIYRKATADFEFAGHRIPGGSDVLVFTSSTHTDPECFADPYRFDIDRYAKPREEHRAKYVFAPYGGGPHVCLGAGMGEGLLLLTVATWLREFQIEAEQPRRACRLEYDPSLCIDAGFRIRVQRRGGTSA